MDSFSSNTELWEVILTVGPLAAGVLGAVIIRRYPHRFGWVFGAYALSAAMIGIAPFVFAGAADSPPTVLQPLLRETKVAIAFGAFLILSAAGLWSRRTRSPAL